MATQSKYNVRTGSYQFKEKCEFYSSATPSCRKRFSSSSTLSSTITLPRRNRLATLTVCTWLLWSCYACLNINMPVSEADGVYVSIMLSTPDRLAFVSANIIIWAHKQIASKLGKTGDRNFETRWDISFYHLHHPMITCSPPKSNSN